MREHIKVAGVINLRFTDKAQWLLPLLIKEL